MNIVDSSILKRLSRPDPESHKGQNGRILIIAGSRKYHGALLLALEAASRIVDMVYVYSPKNTDLIQRLRSEIAIFIPVAPDELWKTVELVDSVLIGPGLEESDESIELTKTILTKYTNKKIVIDATALWHLEARWLHSLAVVTPHSREFKQVFDCCPSADCVQKKAAVYNCTIVLKGKTDYISNGFELWANGTGNVGMTKGGTGDVLAGLISAFLATNNCMDAALAGAYLNGMAGDRLREGKGTFYNAEDLVGELGKLWKEIDIEHKQEL